MQYIAKTDTLLKKAPVQGDTLPDDQKVSTPKEKVCAIEQVIETDGLHSHVKLASGGGDWWIFLPHWDIGESKPDFTPSTNGKVTAVFTLKQAKSNQLIYGSLTFFEDGQEKFNVVATSGVKGHQYAGAQKIRGKGCLPPSDNWKISTHGYHSATKGVEGMFYHITPDPDPHFGRGEFGLHRDANGPGSAGCIVLKDSKIFNDKVVPFVNSLKGRQSQIPLSVVYE